MKYSDKIISVITASEGPVQWWAGFLDEGGVNDGQPSAFRVVAWEIHLEVFGAEEPGSTYARPMVLWRGDRANPTLQVCEDDWIVVEEPDHALALLAIAAEHKLGPL